ncbi:phenolic glucoside malonyltransferase 1-like [Silene latifolia]|uniref:phenolic glucoside malonyltransferase 1-like n=1 Tax=Silene latifolia TaxID=37657 RepID=UPI003D778C7A
MTTIIEESLISFPPDSPCITPTTSSLTFFDYPWLLFPPLQPLFFFQLPLHIHFSDFRSDILPPLKRSLSCALHYYFPLAAKLAASLDDPKRLTFFTDRDCSVSFTFAHSDANFDLLSSNLPRDAAQFRHLVPTLPSISYPINSPASLLAIQITYFSSSPGFSIGFAYHPVLCDQRCFSRFLYSWASLCKFSHLHNGLPSPTFERSVIQDTNSLCPILLQQLSNPRSKSVVFPPDDGLLRATFLMRPADIQNAKKWIMGRCDERNRPYPVLLSPYIVTCAFVWPALFHTSVNKAKGPKYFGFIAGGITRLKYQVPVNYFGNCVGFGRAVAQTEELVGEDGILAAADALALAIKTLDDDILGKAEKWISEWEVIRGAEEHMNVVGSPKVGLYETDFGWGRPKKVEEISIDVIRGISLTQSSDRNGGIEIGLALTKSHMEAFSTLFRQGLHCFSSGGAF